MLLKDSGQEVQNTIRQHTGPYEELLVVVKTRELQWYRYVPYSPTLLDWPKSFFRTLLKIQEGERDQGSRPRIGSDEMSCQNVLLTGADCITTPLIPSRMVES